MLCCGADRLEVGNPPPHLHGDDGLGQDVQRRRQAGVAVTQAAALADALLEVQALLAEALQAIKTQTQTLALKESTLLNNVNMRWPMRCRIFKTKVSDKVNNLLMISMSSCAD